VDSEPRRSSRQTQATIEEVMRDEEMRLLEVEFDEYERVMRDCHVWQLEDARAQFPGYL
jgi:hypothetical protein